MYFFHATAQERSFSTLTVKRESKETELASQPIPTYLENSCCESFHVLCGFSFLSVKWG